jgi:glycerol-3-phosphate dehydrogenase
VSRRPGKAYLCHLLLLTSYFSPLTSHFSPLSQPALPLSPLTSYFLLLDCNDASYRSPPLGVNRLNDLAPVQDGEGLDQTSQLSGTQQVVLRGWAPARLTLRLEKGFHHQQAGRRDQPEDSRHASPVKIIEYQHCIKNAQIGPTTLEIKHPPIDGNARGPGPRLGAFQLSQVPVNGNDLGPQLSRRETVPPIAAGKIEHPRARTYQMSVPEKPTAGPHGRRSLERGTISQLAAQPADLLVIGGGINGAGIARDAAMRGLRTILVEQKDLGSGTSSRSSRLIHGGLRYLEQGEFGMVLQANRERRILRRIAPHLVWPLPFVFPVHRGDRISRWQLAAGMVLYDVLALFRNVRAHRMLGKRGILEAEPMLRDRGLLGGARYYDAQCDDARLVVATARSALYHGALVANYMAVRALERTAGRVVGVQLEDQLTGEGGVVRASVVVNATGPWADRIRRMEDAGAAPLMQPTKGVHVVVDRARIDHRDAIAFTSPIDGRVMFVLPWGNLSYIGTTDTDCAEPPDELTVTQDDLVYLLRSANSRFPSARLSVEDVRGSWAGLRPLLRGRAQRETSSRSREHAIVHGSGGMLTVVGGKLTTYRALAASVVDQAMRELRHRDGRSRGSDARTDEDPLPGGETADLSQFRERGLELGLSSDTVDHLLRHYGTETAGILNLGGADRRLFRRLLPPHPSIEAEVVHAVRRELAQTVEDVLVRRFHLYYEHREFGAPAARRVAELMGEELGWDEERTHNEAEKYRNFVRGTRYLAIPVEDSPCDRS